MSKTTYKIKLQKKNRIWKTTSEVLTDGHYGNVNHLISDGVRKNKITFNSTQYIDREIVLLDFAREVSTREVLDEVRAQKLKSPLLSDSLLFGALHPDEQLVRSIVFLHQPGYLWSGHYFYVTLGAKEGNRSVSMIATSGLWKKDCCFAFVST